jgi:hypothetical protein
MHLCQFVVIGSFSAWSPGDRDRPERRICVSPGERHLFTDATDNAGMFVKFLKNGFWYEAERGDFDRSTMLFTGEAAHGAAPRLG